MPLNDLVCRHAKPTDKVYKLTDFGGMVLEVRPSGKKSWRLRYRFHGVERNLTIGQYPQVSLGEARKAKEEAKLKIKAGVDPSLAKQEAKRLSKYSHAQNFELVAIEWHKQYFDTWKPGHAKLILRRLEIHAFPFIGRLPFQQITPHHFLEVLQRVERIAPEIARKILQDCKRICRYAHLTGRLDKDLTFGLSGMLKKYRKGNYASIDIEELPELLTAMNSNRGRAYKQTRIALNLLMLTAVRTGELLQSTWSEIDFEKELWTIPAIRMKMGKEHLVPLSRQALALFRELKEMNGHRLYVLPSLHFPRKPMSNCTMLNALKRMGYRNKMTGHGFRALFMGISKQKLGYSHEVVDRQLAHVKKSNIDRAYDRATFLPQRTELMQAYADYLDNPTPQHASQRRLNDRQDRSYDQHNKYAISFGTTNFSGGNGAYQIQLRNTLPTDENRRFSEAPQRSGEPDQLLDGGRYPKLH